MHLGGDHGDGEASGGQSSLRQSAGAGSSSEPEIGIATVVEQWTKSHNGSLSKVFGVKGRYRPKGDLRGGLGGQRVQPPPSRALEAPGQGVAPLGASFGLPESSVLHIFYMIFGNFLSTFIFDIFLQCTYISRQKLALGTELVG